MKKILTLAIIFLLLLSTFSIFALQVKAESPEAHGTVYDYKIVSVTQTGPNEVTVKLQVRYCPYCNPNDASNPGCPEFTHGYPPPYYPYNYWCGGLIDGRYVAVRIKDSGGAILGTQKLVCNPTNWPLDVVVTRDFVFSGVTLATGSIVIAEADIYCSWCGHWYPTPVSLKIAPLKVCIDAGHCSNHPRPQNEVFFNRDIALRLRDLLQIEPWYAVIMTRETDDCPGRDLNGDGNIDESECIMTRPIIANENDCDIFVSIHCNAGDETVRGTETYFYDYLGEYFPEVKDKGFGTSEILNGNTPNEEENRRDRSFELAYWVQRLVTTTAGTIDRGLKSDTVSAPGRIYVLRATKMPAILIEVAYKTNPDDYALLADPVFRQNVALGIKEGISNYFFKRGLTFHLCSAADMVVIDPDGLRISKQVNEIPGASYAEIDIDGDGDLDDQVRIPDRKIGDYLITVIPEPDALPTDTYTLEVSLFGESVIIARNVQISEIPTKPYIITSTKAGIIPPIIQATIDFDPDTLNLKSIGKVVTVYIELPTGYGISQINVSSIILNGVISALAKPTEIGDYDGDGIPDLMVKFNRAAVQAILQVSDNVEITVDGKLIDGRLFEGRDIIRVICPP